MDLEKLAQMLGRNEITVRIEDLIDVIEQARAEAWAEGHDAGWSGKSSSDNPYR